MFEFDSYEASPTILGDAAIESEIVLSALRDQCESDKEFCELVTENAMQMGLYGIIDDPEAAIEATKKIIIQDYKNVKLNRLAGRAAIRMAKKANSPDYQKYKKHRDLMLMFRSKIFKKYGAKGKVEAKKILQNAMRKSTNIGGKGGKSITEKIDNAIKNKEK